MRETAPPGVASTRGRVGAALVASLLIVGAPVATGDAGRLPVRAFGVAEGLAHPEIWRIVGDSSGFLWFCTGGGLSRFDGARFRSYGAADGLGGPAVGDLLEDPDRGVYWVGTSDGLYRFSATRAAEPGGQFERVELPVGGAVRRLVRDARGRVWIGTSRGLARIDPSPDGDRARAIELVPEIPRTSGVVMALLPDGDGGVWVGTHGRGLYLVGPDGATARHWPSSLPGLFFVRDLIRGPDGRIWGTYFGGVARFHADPRDREDPVERRFDRTSGLPSGDTSQLLTTPEGGLLVGSTAGVSRIERGGDGSWSLAGTWSADEGLGPGWVRSAAYDPAGNLWLGTSSRGAMEVVRSGFRRFPELEESGSVVVAALGEPDGTLLAMTAVPPAGYRLHRLGADAPPVDLRLPEETTYLGWGGKRLVRDGRGRYWVATGSGLLRYDPREGEGPERLARAADRRYTSADGLSGNDVFWIAEDAAGRIWVAVSEPDPGRGSVTFLPPGASRFEEPEPRPGRSPGDLAWGFAASPDGSVWIRYASGELARVDRGGRARPVPAGSDPDGPAALERDSRGRLWILSRGACVLDEPASERPGARPGPEALADADVFCMVEDDEGRLYFGSDRGVVRIDERTGATRLFTRADGLPGDTVVRCVRDARGDLWFGDPHGLARLARDVAEPRPPPSPRIVGVQVDGEDIPLPLLGGARIGPLRPAPGTHRVAVQFLAIGHAPGELLAYQYRFAQEEDWSEPSEARGLELPRLGPGEHRLLVRALSGDGDPAAPAELTIEIPAPFWQRAWFLAAVVLALAAAAHAAYRIRVARLLALERVRTRIATDLHDEVGADLSRISLLAEFARHDLDARPERARSMLGEVARTARDAVSGMSDIVWALKPERDSLGQVVTRVRDFAAQAAAGSGASLQVELDDELASRRLAGERRRDLYLLLKEAAHNAVRHAGARHLTLSVTAAGRGLRVELRDDGKGFDPDEPGRPGPGGHGLAHMQARAARLGGRLAVKSAPGRGTAVRLDLPGT